MMSEVEETSPLLPKDKSPNGQEETSKQTKYWRTTIICILLTEMCERLTFFSVTSNMVLFCTNVLQLTSIQAVTVSLIFIACCYTLPVFGGFIADSIAGRYNTIYGAVLLYLLGALFIIPASIDYTVWTDKPYIGLSMTGRRGIFIAGISLISIGTAGVKSNVNVFGAQQVAEVSNNTIRSFFSWSYWMSSLGTLIALSVIVYIQQQYSFALGYMAAAMSILISLVVFVLPRNYYKKTPPTESPLLRVFQIIQAGVSLRRSSAQPLPWFLDHASDKYGGPYAEMEVEGVRSVIRMLPLFCATILYTISYSQVLTTYVLQGERLNLKLGDFVIPVASLGMINVLFTLLLIPFVDRVVYPLLAKCNIKPTQIQRIGFGFFLGAVSVGLAGYLEILRKQEMAKNGALAQDIAGVVYNASSYSVLWQTPQYLLSGGGEIMAAIAGLEFAYSQSPPSLQGIVMGLYLVTMGGGAILGTVLINIVNSVTSPDEWIPNEINDGYLENFFFLLCVLTLLDLVLFIIYTKYFFKYASYSINYDVTGFGSLETEGLRSHTCSSEYETDITGTQSFTQ